MSGATEYTIGAEVSCRDGVCGELTRVVVDPVARALTHLVVQPKHRPGLGRLVPIGLVDANAAEFRLRCGASEFDALEEAEETRFLSEAGEPMGYGAGEVVSWPYYGLDTGMAETGALGMGMASAPSVLVYDRVPTGEVEVRRGDSVHAKDGNIGRVQGLVVDPADHHVTHVLLERGHLWGKREIAIPIGAVKDVAADGVRLDLTKDDVRHLPPVDLARHD